MAISRELEKEYWRELVNSPQGRWLIKTLIDNAGCFVTPQREGGLMDAIRGGRKDLIMREIVQPIAFYLGWYEFDNIMKGQK